MQTKTEDGLLDLSRVTYLSILPNEDTSGNNSIDKILKIGHETSKGIKFNKKVVYTAQDPSGETYGFEIVKIEPINYGDFDIFVLNNYTEFFQSDFMINFHSDGMIMNPSSWEDEFFNYDYLGGPWNDHWNGGNGGFSMRSKKFCDLSSRINFNMYWPKRSGDDNEDAIVCRREDNKFIEKGIKYAPYEVNLRFSTEYVADTKEQFLNSFGFHEIEKIGIGYLKEHRQNYLNEILSK